MSGLSHSTTWWSTRAVTGRTPNFKRGGTYKGVSEGGRRPPAKQRLSRCLPGPRNQEVLRTGSSSQELTACWRSGESAAAKLRSGPGRTDVSPSSRAHARSHKHRRCLFRARLKSLAQVLQLLLFSLALGEPASSKAGVRSVTRFARSLPHYVEPCFLTPATRASQKKSSVTSLPQVRGPKKVLSNIGLGHLYLTS